MAKSFNAVIAARFAHITSSVQKANVYIHETGMMIMRHAKEHNDCSLAQGLVMAMPASMRREMMIAWFARFSPIVVKNDDKFSSKAWKPGQPKYVEYDLEAAEATPFWVMAEQQKEKPPIDLEGLMKLVANLVNKIEKEAEKDGVDDVTRLAATSLALQLSAVKPVLTTPANDIQEAQPAPSQNVA